MITSEAVRMVEAHQTLEWIGELEYGGNFLMRCYHSSGHRKLFRSRDRIMERIDMIIYCYAGIIVIHKSRLGNVHSDQGVWIITEVLFMAEQR